MVKEALKAAAAYKTIELQVMEQLAPGGALLSAEAQADILGRLGWFRSWVSSQLIAAKSKATEEDARELTACLLLVNSTCNTCEVL